MDHSLLRSWLGLPPGPWPPDHYTLLGLTVGRADPAAVEPRVMERMDLLRRHQLVHPDLVTEGMNRLAQALITLTDPAGKSAYDRELGATDVRPPEPRPLPPVEAEPMPPVVVAEPVFDDDVFADEEAPDQRPDAAEVTQVIDLRAPEPLPAPYELVPDEEVARPPRPRPAPPPGLVEAEVLALPTPTPDDRTPASRRWIYARLALIRRAIRAWDRLRPVIGDPHDPIDRPGRVVILLEAAWAVRPLLPPLRGVVGGVGQPGGVVAAVVRNTLILDTIRRLLPDQRQALAADWWRGREELQSEYDRLRRLAGAGKHRSVAARGLPVVVRWLAAVPELVLVGLAALAVFVALVRTVRRH